MDNQEVVKQDSKLGKFLTRRNIVIFFIMVIILEVIWSFWVFFKPEQLNFGLKNETILKPNSIKLTSAQKSLKVGEKVTVGIGIVANSHTDGADIIISFDPKLLSVETVDGKPVKVGTIYDDYPQNVLDEKLGVISFSGVSSQPYGIETNGFMGTINFIAKAAGVAKISVDHTPGLTSDSNLTQTKTAQDILEEVVNLELNIVP